MSIPSLSANTPDLHRPHVSAHTQFRASAEMMNGSRAIAGLESHLRLFTNHEYAAASLLVQFNESLSERMQTQQKALKVSTREIRLSSMDAEDASDVAKRLYTDCTAHFANIGMMLDALMRHERRVDVPNGPAGALTSPSSSRSLQAVSSATSPTKPGARGMYIEGAQQSPSSMSTPVKLSHRDKPHPSSSEYSSNSFEGEKESSSSFEVEGGDTAYTPLPSSSGGINTSDVLTQESSHSHHSLSPHR